MTDLSPKAQAGLRGFCPSMVTWVLEQDSRESRMAWNQAIINRLEQTNHNWVEIKIIPFVREVVGGDPHVEGPVVAYGSTAIRDVVERNNWKPGIWNVEDVRESAVASALGPLYLNHDMVVVPAREAAQAARERGWELFFAKPDTDDKEFPGSVFDQERYPFFIEQMIACEWVKEDFPVCVSSIKQLGVEWRLVVVDGRVADYSIYRQWQTVMPSREIYQEVLDTAEKAISLHNPAPVFVIDIARLGNELKIVEYNGFNSAGLYACDVINVVDRVNEYVISNYVPTSYKN